MCDIIYRVKIWCQLPIEEVNHEVNHGWILPPMWLTLTCASSKNRSLFYSVFFRPGHTSAPYLLRSTVQMATTRPCSVCVCSTLLCTTRVGFVSCIILFHSQSTPQRCSDYYSRQMLDKTRGPPISGVRQNAAPLNAKKISACILRVVLR